MSTTTTRLSAPTRRSKLIGLTSFAVVVALLVTGGIVIDLAEGFAARDAAISANQQSRSLYTEAQDAEASAASIMAARVADASLLATGLDSLATPLASLADDAVLTAAAGAGAGASAAVTAAVTPSSGAGVAVSAQTADSVSTTVTPVSTVGMTTTMILAEAKALDQARTDTVVRTQQLADATAALDAQIAAGRTALVAVADSVVTHGNSILEDSDLASSESRDALTAAMGVVAAAAAGPTVRYSDLPGTLTAYSTAAQAVQASQSAGQSAADEAARVAAANAERSSGSGSSGSGSGSSNDSGWITFPLAPITWSLTCSDIITGTTYPC